MRVDAILASCSGAHSDPAKSFLPVPEPFPMESRTAAASTTMQAVEGCDQAPVPVVPVRHPRVWNDQWRPSRLGFLGSFAQHIITSSPADRESILPHRRYRPQTRPHTARYLSPRSSSAGGGLPSHGPDAVGMTTTWVVTRIYAVNKLTSEHRDPRGPWSRSQYLEQQC